MKSANNQFDDSKLDEMLKKYGDSEPRPDLEDRVLAHISIEREGSGAGGWNWRLALAVLAVGAVAAVGVFMTPKPGSPPVTPVKETASSKTGSDIPTPVVTYRKPHLTAKQVRRERSPQKAAQTEPRLEQFPSPTPLNEQEQLLIRFIRDRPKDAAMVARLQTELRDKEFPSTVEQLPGVEKPPDSQE
jgi:hypothetical protein